MYVYDKLWNYLAAGWIYGELLFWIDTLPGCLYFSIRNLRSLNHGWSSRKAWLLTTTYGYSFPLFSSLLKKEGRRKVEWSSKNRDQKACLSAQSIVYWFQKVSFKYMNYTNWRLDQWSQSYILYLNKYLK